MATLWIVSASYDTSKSAKNQPRRMRPKVYPIDSESEEGPTRPFPLRQIGEVFNNVAHYSGAYETETEARDAATRFS